MKASRFRLPIAAASITLLLAPDAYAGQRRVDVGVGGGSIQFGPQTQTLNINDHVTWVWVTGGHTVTNGSDPLSDPNAGTIFDSGFLSGGTQSFSWKADRTGSVPFYCDPHFSFGMTGTLQISPSGVSVSSFRITEVQYDEATGKDRIEIANLGGDFGDLGRYRISINGTTSALVPLPSVSVVSGSSPGRVVIHTNEGTAGSSQTDLFMGGIGNLPTSGSVALYVPNTKLGTSLADATQIIDFVQWGAASQPNAATAVAAGVWPSTGEFVDPVPVVGNYDLAFCGLASDRGKAFWNIAHPNFRTQTLCATPTRATTWGRIKVLYR
jgi:plastocyanin